MELVLDFSVELEDENFEALIEEITDDDNLEDYIEEVLEMEHVYIGKPIYMSLLLTGNDKIQEINKEFRAKDMATDVISFAYHETEEFDLGPYDTLGDIVISLERVKEQAEEYGHSFYREFYYVLTHGILHLLGYDHIDENDKKIMREKEEEILGHFGYTREMV